MPKASSSLWQRLHKEIQKTRVVDCHSHMMSRESYYAGPVPDLFKVTGYFSRDMWTILGEEAFSRFQNLTNDEGRWQALRHALSAGQNVSYWRHCVVGYQQLYGLKAGELTDENWKEVNAAIKAKGKDSNWYHHLVKDLAKVDVGILNVDPFDPAYEPEYAVPSVRMEQWLEFHRKEMVDKLASYTDSSIGSLRALLGAMEKALGSYKAKGAVAIKSAHAYGRTLYHEKVSTATASALFQKTLKRQKMAAKEVKQLQDFILFWLAGKAGELGLVFQIHTGLQGNLCHIPDSSSMHLLNLLRTFPKTKFDLFHASYPWTIEHGVIAKHFPNVWPNLCWMYVISMEGSRRTLDEWIDLVPGHRILGFGSDVGYPENVFSHVFMAKRCITDVLAKKVEEDFLSEDGAVHLAGQILRENAVELFGLKLG